HQLAVRRDIVGQRADPVGQLLDLLDSLGDRRRIFADDRVLGLELDELGLRADQDVLLRRADIDELLGHRTSFHRADTNAVENYTRLPRYSSAHFAWRCYARGNGPAAQDAQVTARRRGWRRSRRSR